jgi:hypothetical protein
MSKLRGFVAMTYDPKTAFATRVWQRAKQGWGTEDIFVSLRHFGVTMEYIRSVVSQVEAARVRGREYSRAKRKKAS